MVAMRSHVQLCMGDKAGYLRATSVVLAARRVRVHGSHPSSRLSPQRTSNSPSGNEGLNLFIEEDASRERLQTLTW